MKIARNAVVSLTYTLSDAQGELIERAQAPVAYLHGGYGSIFPRVEQALAGKSAGEVATVRLEPEDAFGDYDAERLRVEPRDRFPEVLEVGMQFEGIPGDGAEAGAGAEIFTVTDIADGKVVLDANHPLAGIALVFECRIADVRAATEEEIAHGHAHGPGGQAH